MRRFIIFITTLAILLSTGVSAEILYTGKQLQTVPQIYQLPELPWGCEATALAGLCNYYGYKFTKREIWDRIPVRKFEYKNGRAYSAHPDDAMTVDSKGKAFGIYAPLAVKILNQMIYEAGGTHRAVDLSGCSEEELFRDLPKVVWASGKMEPTVPNSNKWYVIRNGVHTDEAFYWQGNEHAMVLLSATETTVRVMDPISGTVNYDRATFLKEWKNQGYQVLAFQDDVKCKVYINTYQVDFKNTSPVIDGDKVYVPVIPIFRMLGLKVYYEDKHHEAIVMRDGKYLMYIKGNSNDLVVDSKSVVAENAIKVLDGVLMADIEYLISIQSLFWCKIEYKIK